jgi:hypothetical protein
LSTEGARGRGGAIDILVFFIQDFQKKNISKMERFVTSGEDTRYIPQNQQPETRRKRDILALDVSSLTWLTLWEWMKHTSQA